MTSLSPDEAVALAGGATSTREPVGIVLIPASSVTPERVSWAWDQRVPIGMASLLVGAGGLGKSLQFCALAAGWSRGTVPGDFFGTPVDVAIASAEDQRAAVIVPRLLAAGADLRRIHFLQQIDPDGDASDIAIDGEVAALEETLVAGKVRVMLVDTVVAHIPAVHDTYNEQRVRAVLKPLAKMAERHDMVVLGVMHLNRRETRDVLTRISGSGGFGNLARSVMLFARDPDDPEGPTRILASAKSNVGGSGETLKLRLESCLVRADDGREIQSARLVEVGASSFTSTELLAAPADSEERNAVSEAADVLRDILADGPVEAKEAKRRVMDLAGVSARTVDTAKKSAAVITFHHGFGKDRGPWLWRLPDYRTQADTVERSVPVPASYGDSLRPTVEPLDANVTDELPLGDGDGVAAVLAAFPGSRHRAHRDRGDVGAVAPTSPTAASIADQLPLDAVVHHPACPGCGSTAAAILRGGVVVLCARCAPPPRSRRASSWS
jgi:hypothetical protein